MARREMGGHWSSEEEWEVSAMRALKRFRKYRGDPLAATRMTSSQRASAVERKKTTKQYGSKPTNVATFAKKEKK